MFTSILLSLGDKIFGGVTNYFKVKQEHKVKLEQKDMDLKVAKVTSQISMIEKQQDTDNSIDLYTIKDRGIKDDIITYTIISPFVILLLNPIGAIIFGYDPQVITIAMIGGFTALESIPENMWYGLLIVLSDVFGLRSFMRTVFTGIAGKITKKINP